MEANKNDVSVATKGDKCKSKAPQSSFLGLEVITDIHAVFQKVSKVCPVQATRT